MNDRLPLRKPPETPWRDFRHRLRVGLLVCALIVILTQIAAAA